MAAPGSFHGSEMTPAADEDREPKQLHLDRVSRQLPVTRNTGEPLDDVESAECRLERQVAPLGQCRPFRGVERAIGIAREPRVEAREHVTEAPEVLGVRRGNDVDILRSANRSMSRERDRADQDVSDLAAIQDPEQAGYVNAVHRVARLRCASARRRASCRFRASRRSSRSAGVNDASRLRRARRASALSRASISEPVSTIQMLRRYTAGLALGGSAVSAGGAPPLGTNPWRAGPRRPSGPGRRSRSRRWKASSASRPCAEAPGSDRSGGARGHPRRTGDRADPGARRLGARLSGARPDSSVGRAPPW